MKLRFAVLLLALVAPSSAQQRLAPPMRDLPRYSPPREGEAYPIPPADGACDRREWVRLTHMLLEKPPEPTIFECRPSTAWRVCQWVGIMNGNGNRMLNILADLESLEKICRKQGFGQPPA
jgi:hypothetical protein